MIFSTLLSDSTLEQNLNLILKQGELELEIQELSDFLSEKNSLDEIRFHELSIDATDLDVVYNTHDFAILGKYQLLAVIIGGLLLMLASRIIYAENS